MLFSKNLDLRWDWASSLYICQVSLLLWRASTALSASVDLVVDQGPAVLRRYKQNRWAQF